MKYNHHAWGKVSNEFATPTKDSKLIKALTLIITSRDSTERFNQWLVKSEQMMELFPSEDVTTNNIEHFKTKLHPCVLTNS